MITSAKNYTKTNEQTKKDRQNGKSKAIQIKSHTQKHTHTHSQKEEKGKK